MSSSSLVIMTGAKEVAHLIQGAAVKKGFTPTLFNGGVSLIAALESLKPHLMILDLDLTDMDGVELLNYLVKIKSRTPIILMCGMDDKLLFSLNHIGHEKKLNIIANLKYPFSEDELEKTLEATSQRSSFIEPSDLAQAIEQNHLTLYYQPKIDIKTKKWVGVESLIRWLPPEKSVIPPDLFIAIAEDSGLIAPMTSWVINKAFEDAKYFTVEKGLAINVAVNLSAGLLSDPFFPDEVVRIAKEMDLPHKTICFEVTESATSKQPEAVLEVLVRLRLRGFSLSIDDFGTGYSSLFELQRLPFNELKIDKSFVTDIEHNRMNQAVVKSIIYLGHSLGLKLVAEGVETQAAFNLLNQWGCDIAQGYLISCPLSLQDLEKWKQKNIADDLTWKNG